MIFKILNARRAQRPILGGLLSEELRSLSSVLYMVSLLLKHDYFTPVNGIGQPHQPHLPWLFQGQENLNANSAKRRTLAPYASAV
jgi:hypothetical protein